MPNSEDKRQSWVIKMSKECMGSFTVNENSKTIIRLKKMETALQAANLM
jgi:hypothetical protein